MQEFPEYKPKLDDPNFTEDTNGQTVVMTYLRPLDHSKRYSADELIERSREICRILQVIPDGIRRIRAMIQNMNETMRGLTSEQSEFDRACKDIELEIMGEIAADKAAFPNDKARTAELNRQLKESLDWNNNKENSRKWSEKIDRISGFISSLNSDISRLEGQRAGFDREADLLGREIDLQRQKEPIRLNLETLRFKVSSVSQEEEDDRIDMLATQRLVQKWPEWLAKEGYVSKEDVEAMIQTAVQEALKKASGIEAHDADLEAAEPIAVEEEVMPVAESEPDGDMQPSGFPDFS